MDTIHKLTSEAAVILFVKVNMYPGKQFAKLDVVDFVN